MDSMRSMVSTVVEWFSPTTKEEPVSHTTKYEPRRPFRIWSLDGGGVREMIVATLIPEILKRAGVNRLSELGTENTMLIGTSAGGLVGAALVAQHKNGDAVIETAKIPEFWKERTHEVFHASWLNTLESFDGLRTTKYAATGLEKAIGAIFKETMTLEENLSIPAVFPAFRFNDKESQTLYFAPQGKFPSLNGTLSKIQNITLSKVLRSTAAAPTYLPAEVWGDYNYVDGGLFSNNPAAHGVLLASQIAKFEDIEVLSFGTGTAPHTIAYKELIYGGTAKYAPIILNMMFKGQELSPGELLGSKYDRFQLEIDHKYDALDGIENLNYFEEHTFTWIKENEDRLNTVAAKLKLKDPGDSHAQEQETY